MKKTIPIWAVLISAYILASFGVYAYPNKPFLENITHQNETPSVNNMNAGFVFSTQISRGGTACISSGNGCHTNITVNVVSENIFYVTIEGIGSEVDGREFGELVLDGFDADNNIVTYIVPTHILQWNGSAFEMPYSIE